MNAKYLVILLLALTPILVYADSHPIEKEWGYVSIADPSWGPQPTFLGDLIQGGLSPNEDGMQIKSIYHYLVDNEDPAAQQPFWKFGVYIGGTETDPTGAVKIAETQPYYLELDGWQELYLDTPVDWPKNTPTWIVISDYNGFMQTTWNGLTVESTDNYNPESTNRGFFVLPFRSTSIENPLSDTIPDTHYQYGKAYAMYVEYTVPPPPPAPPEDPIQQIIQAIFQILFYFNQAIVQLQIDVFDLEQRVSLLENKIP